MWWRVTRRTDPFSKASSPLAMRKKILLLPIAQVIVYFCAGLKKSVNEF
jgi:hypothetical protein